MVSKKGNRALQELDGRAEKKKWQNWKTQNSLTMASEMA